MKPIIKTLEGMKVVKISSKKKTKEDRVSEILIEVFNLLRHYNIPVPFEMLMDNFKLRNYIKRRVK